MAGIQLNGTTQVGRVIHPDGGAYVCLVLADVPSGEEYLVTYEACAARVMAYEILEQANNIEGTT